MGIKDHKVMSIKRFATDIDEGLFEKIEQKITDSGVSKRDFTTRVFTDYFSKKDDVLTEKDIEKYEAKIKELKDYIFKLHDKYDKATNECMALKEALARQSELETEPDIAPQEEQEVAQGIAEKKRLLQRPFALSRLKNGVKFLPKLLFLMFCIGYFITRYGSVSTEWERYVVYNRYHAYLMDRVIGDQALPMSVLLSQDSKEYEKLTPKNVLDKMDYEPYYFHYFWGTVRETLIILFAGLFIILYRFLSHRYKE